MISFMLSLFDKSKGVLPYKFLTLTPVEFFSKIKFNNSSCPWDAQICTGKFFSLSLVFIFAPFSISNLLMSK